LFKQPFSEHSTLGSERASHCIREKNYDIKFPGGFMFNIGLPELLIIVAIALIVFGPNKLPELAKAFGRAMREFKKATDEVKESFEAETKELEEYKHTLTDENLLADLAEQISPPEPTTEETSPQPEPSAAAETPPLEEASSQAEEGKAKEKKKEGPEGAKEGIPSHG
jgi:TatA/E family protein of Tat protein translocase